MARDSLQYDRMVENALRGVVRQALSSVAERGLPGNHHFYLTFRTCHPGVEIADRLRAQYPQEMTIVLQHQFWGLEVGDDAFTVNLSFSNVPERLKIPYAALVSFVDPSVKFGLQFQVPQEAADGPQPTEKQSPSALLPKDTRALAGVGGQPETADKAKTSRLRTDKAGEGRSDGKEAGAEPAQGNDAESGKKPPEKVISLDAFRKK